MIFSNLKLLPTESPTYEAVTSYLVPTAIPLLLFRANVARIMRESGSMLIAFHVAAAGSLVGSLLAGFLFQSSVDRVAEVAGIMAGSYIGGSVNFVAIQNHYRVSPDLANPLIVADNFIMAGMFGMLFLIANSAFFRRHYRHPHSLELSREQSRSLAAQHWDRKGISLLDIAKALGIAVAIAAFSIKLAALLRGSSESKWLHSLFGNPYLMITTITVLVTTLFHRRMEQINGAEELGAYFLYVFFFVIGLQADFMRVLWNVPILFGFCLLIAAVNLVVTLAVGKLLRLNLEELLLGVNATLGGPPSAVAMAIAAGWPRLVLPGLLAGLWGYIIGTFLGIAVAETLRRLLP